MPRAMQSIWASLKGGSWLTPERLRLYPALLLALLPYGLALGVWQLSTLPLYLAGVRGALRESGISGRDVLVAALAFPAVFVNLTHGQNGFLTAGLFAGALLCLETRPWLAGLM